MNEQIDAFWAWVQHNASALRSAVLKAGQADDVEALNAIVSIVYEKIADISEELVVDLHVDPDELTLAVRTAHPDRSLVDRILARAPRIPHWTFATSIPRDLDSVLVRAPDGRSLSVPYDALSFDLSFDQPDGRCRILVVFDGDFDPEGPDAPLFHDVATHVLTTFLGRIPDAVASYSLVPARLGRQVKTRPIVEIEDAWRKGRG